MAISIRDTKNARALDGGILAAVSDPTAGLFRNGTMNDWRVAISGTLIRARLDS